MKQQPDDSAAVLMDKQCREDVAAALGFIRGGNYAWSYLLQQIKDTVSASEQQPTPDVTQLVEALDRIRAMDSMSYHSLESAKIVAHAALSAYRKGGDTP